MDRIQSMQIFTRVAETESFIRAAETLSLPPSTVTSTIKHLERYLEVRLFNRTTRQVSLTPEGLQYLEQCREILSLVEHAESSIKASVKSPQGRLRVDMPSGIAHFIVMPNLADFYRKYPDIYLKIGVSDRQVDLIQEGIDCVIRVGKLNNSALIARPLGKFRWVTCASPDYLNKNGIPQSPDELSNHTAIHYFSEQSRRTDDMYFSQGNKPLTVQVDGKVAVNETGLCIKMCIAGFGLAQLAENIIKDHLQEKKLIEVLTDWQPPALPVTLLYPHKRFVSLTVKVFADWIAELIKQKTANRSIVKQAFL